MSATMKTTTAMETPAVAASRGVATTEAIATAVSVAATITIGVSIGVVRIGVTVCDRGRRGIIAGGWSSIIWAGSLSRLIVAVARSLIGIVLIVVRRRLG
jgi:hypothetical protein